MSQSRQLAAIMPAGKQVHRHCRVRPPVKHRLRLLDPGDFSVNLTPRISVKEVISVRILKNKIHAK